MSELAQEVDRRRTFAIISHPDAGKTTLTEKLLLYGGAIHLAGAVKARASQRHVTSDWMELEQQRGISITSTVLQFSYMDCCVNLLDTPGHKDFSEDTYRTLAAADNAVMLVDAAKGLETQTRKLFEVCKLRSLPIFTFINKLDRPTREPLELLDEIEKELGLIPYAMNWPIGTGDRFRGVFDRSSRTVHLFKRSGHGQREADVEIMLLDDPRLPQIIDPDLYAQFLEDLEVLETMGAEWNEAAMHGGSMTPIFFGSAMTNFGVELFLKAFLQHALKPTPHDSTVGEIAPTDEEFSAFVFKLQANMDPKHRDRIAFVRVCSGKFEKDMTVNHVRSGKTIRLSHAQKLFGQDREIIAEAYAGDVIGLNNPGTFAIGDTICGTKKFKFAGIPSFSPELFAYLRSPEPSKFKQFRKGVSELKEEGAIQIMYSVDDAKRDPILGAVGQLQFEVVQFRLQSEYGVETLLDPLPYSVARWVEDGWEALEETGRLFNTLVVKDSLDRPVLLFKNIWNLNQVESDHPELKLKAIAPI
ncbi:peptide chain release factor 3 [Synechococcus sp. PCC 7502]|uniref:peptide chain release factor 3 n=1 Tax=Synechococcus sp. PCC 7502 TaxID=1173263 RepID=UPI00029FD75D|nr:peptide chain release factor 3 [Synechococcus sp. PCC 7502]AFY74333.1 peptide chain release factor 3 [Synechococcus sp. PCC 7502]